MANTLLGSKSVGDIVKLKVNGAAKNFIVVHQGKPSDVYDDSCNGAWLLMEDIYESIVWNTVTSTYNNSYSRSSIRGRCSTFLDLLDARIRNVVKTVKIPYINDKGSTGSVASGANGLSVQVFLLSYTEVFGIDGGGESNVEGANLSNFNTIAMGESNVEGAILSYFNNADASKCIGKLNGVATAWWLRSPSTFYDGYACGVNASGRTSSFDIDKSYGFRPALILPSTLYVNDNGEVITNSAPTITSTSGSSGVVLGTKNEGFDFSYTVADADGDNLTVTEKLNGVTKKTFSTTGGTYTFEAVNAENFYKVLNGSHTLTVTVSDGTDTTTFTATFTKSVTSASITLETPITIEGDITAAVMSVVGDIPGDAEYKAEVTNNANDSIPVWQDVTNEVKLGQNIIFENTTTGNGAAFNFRVTVKRGSSNTGGYITAVTGAFQ